MTHISFYPRESWTPGKDALHVVASASPSEALSHTSALGAGLYSAANELEIDTYPASHGVVFEGNVGQIDRLRPDLQRSSLILARQALSIAKSFRGELDLIGGESHLASIIERFGEPTKPGDSTFQERLIPSIARFADETTWDGCNVYVNKSPHLEPLAPDVQIALLEATRYDRDNLRDETIPLPEDIIEDIRTLGQIDNNSFSESIRAGLLYYTKLRRADPAFSQKLKFAQRLKQRHGC